MACKKACKKHLRAYDSKDMKERSLGARKKFKKVREKELPSFLLNLKVSNESNLLLQKNEPNVHLGPIFFGCKQYHPPLHSLNLADVHQPKYTASYKENFLEGLFHTKPIKSQAKEESQIRKSFHPVIKRKKFFTDPFPHKCLGNKKAFKPQVAPFTIDLGETKSTIEGETSREIPLCWLKKVSSGMLKAEFEIVSPSDIVDRKRPFLPYKERMAHTHFPKEFVTVEVIGPTIPAALTLTKIHSRRECEVAMDVQVDSETKVETTKEKAIIKDENAVIDAAELEEEKEEEIEKEEEEEKEEVESIETNISEKYEESEESFTELEKTISSRGESEEKETSLIFTEEEQQNATNPQNIESDMEN